VAWDPDQYHRFRSEREAPFDDLLDLVAPSPGGRVVDLGCGSGELTVRLHRHVGAGETVGIDRSAPMLARAAGLAAPGVTFAEGDIGGFADVAAWDVVASNAALHWVPDHGAVLARWTTALRPGGQLAVQVPANADHPAHRLVGDVAAEMAGAFDGEPPADPVLSVLRPEEYAALLERLGFAAQHVRLQVYGHRLASSLDVVEWLQGSTLTRFRAVLSDADYAAFLERYRTRLTAVLGDRAPYFYTFKRILLWGRLAA